MHRHASGPLLHHGWMVIAACLVTAVLASSAPVTAAEIAPRKVAFRVPDQAGQVQAWGPFTFGMTAAEADGAARQAGGRMVPAGGASTVGQPVAYHGPGQTKEGTRRRGDIVLVWFEGGRLSRVTLVLFRLDLRSAEACLRVHRTAIASVLRNHGALKGAGGARGTLGGSDEPGQPMAETGDAAWATELEQSRSRAVVETTWEAPVSAMQAGADETCTGTMTYLPAT